MREGFSVVGLGRVASKPWGMLASSDRGTRGGGVEARPYLWPSIHALSLSFCARMPGWMGGEWRWPFWGG